MVTLEKLRDQLDVIEDTIQELQVALGDIEIQQEAHTKALQRIEAALAQQPTTSQPHPVEGP